MGVTDRQIAICGAFDMQNFGDLMFPVLARERLTPLGFTVTAVAPTDSDPGMGLGRPRPSSALSDLDWALDGVLIGGGYIIHTQAVSRIVHLEQPSVPAQETPPELVECWAGATLAAAARGIPVAWNAPGVPFPFSTGQQPLVASVAQAAGYLSVRDRSSADLLDPHGQLDVSIVPDPIAELSRFWPRPMLQGVEQACRQRLLIPSEASILALHIRDRSLSGYGAERLAQRIGEFAVAQGLFPVLLAMGQAHDDGAVARSVAHHLSCPHAILDKPVSLQEVAAISAAARIYMGASLHGYIAAASYGVPGALVARPAYGKFQGFVEHAGWPEDLCRDWDLAFDRAATLMTQPARRPLPAQIGAALDAHWARIVTVLSSKANVAERGDALLRRYALQGTHRLGPGWLTAPMHVKRKDRR